MQTNELLINDDEDKFMKKLEAGGGESEKVYEMDREQEKQKKREAKKDLKFYDNDQADAEMEKIKKEFYIESTEIAKMSEKEVQEYRKINGDIKVRGLNCMKPVKNWY